MDDYILIPNLIKNVDTIYSRNLHHFFNAVNPVDNKIPLEIIRSIYLKDKNYFLDVVDELTLRGFHFFTSKPNNILPTFTPDFSN